MFRFATKCARRAVAMMLVTASSAFAQSSGRIVGRVTDAKGAPVSGVQILIAPAGVAALTGEDGKYMARSVPAGAVSLTTHRFGYKPKVSAATVVAGQDVTVDVQLETAVVQLAGVVASASRRIEKITDAPATITRLEEPQIANTIQVPDPRHIGLRRQEHARAPHRHPRLRLRCLRHAIRLCLGGGRLRRRAG